MGSLYLGGPTIQEVDGKMMMGLSIYGVAVISASLYSRFYGITLIIYDHNLTQFLYNFFKNIFIKWHIVLCFRSTEFCSHYIEFHSNIILILSQAELHYCTVLVFTERT